MDSHWNRLPPPAPGAKRTAERYFGPPARHDPTVEYGADAPQAFLVEMAPGTHLGVHFHPIQQFQVFVTGRGRFGHHDVGPGVVHFTDGLTPYGPLTPGDAGIRFLTLRARTDSDAFYMPESRPNLTDARANDAGTGRTRRNTTMGAAWPADERRWTVELDEPDGARVARLRLRQGDSVPFPTVDGAGAYLVAVTGSITIDPPAAPGADGALYWIPTGTTGTLRADADADIIALQLPRIDETVAASAAPE